MSFSLPPIVKAAERLMLEIEQAVRRFPRYHKYTHGTRLREQAMNIARLAHRAWRKLETALRPIIETAQDDPARVNFVAVHRQLIGAARALLGSVPDGEVKS